MLCYTEISYDFYSINLIEVSVHTISLFRITWSNKKGTKEIALGWLLHSCAPNNVVVVATIQKI